MKSDKRLWPWAAAFVAFWLVFWFWHTWGYWEDDAYIHIEYARHVAQGQGFMFQGQLSNGDTSPAWVLLLAGVTAGATQWWWGGKLLTVLSLVFTLVVLWRFVLRLEADWLTEDGAATQAPWVICLFLASPYFCYWAFSGMEAVLAAGWLLAQGLLLAPRRTSWVTVLGAAFFMGLGPLLRPEFVLLFPVGGPFLLWQWHRLSASWTPASRWGLFLAATVLLALPLTAWSAYALHAFGHVMPNTNAAKRAMPGDPVASRMLQVMGLGYPGIFLAAAVLVLSALIAGRRYRGGLRSVPMLAWPVVMACGAILSFYVINRTQVQTRYVTALAPALLAVGWVAMARRVKPRVVQGVTAFTLVLGLTTSAFMAYPHLRNKVEGIQRTHELAEHIKATLPAGTRIAVYSIGQLGLELPDHVLIDVGGITQPAAVPYLMQGGAAIVGWARTQGATHYVWGDAPEPGSQALAEFTLGLTSWFLNPSRYDERAYLRLWRLPETPTLAVSPMP